MITTKNVYTIKIENDLISRQHINECLNIFTKIKEDNLLNPELEIIANKKIIDIDFSLIGHLILMKKEKSDLQISLIFNQNENDYDNIMEKLKQLMVHACYCANFQPFTLIFSGGEILEEKELKKDRLFVLSKKIMPIIYVDEKNYQSSFDASMTLLPLHGLAIKNNKNDKGNKTGNEEEHLYQACRRLLFKKKNVNNYLLILAQVAFYGSLRNSKSLRYYLYDQLSEKNKEDLNLPPNKNDIQVGNVQDYEKKKKYNETISLIFDELKIKAPIYHLIFYTLTSADILDSSIKTDTIEAIETKIFNLWGFTKELVYGINELAKNSQQHSSRREGIVVGHIDSTNNFTLKIFDHGEISVIDTFLKNTTTSFCEAKSPFKEIYEKDKKTIESNFHFSSLFSIDHAQLLEQQTKRATAHLGLLFFSRLIEENQGKLFASTNNASNSIIQTYPRDSAELTINIGTHYDISLSIEREKEYIPYKIKTLKGGGIHDSYSVEKLLGYTDIRLENNYNPQSIDQNKQYIFNINLPKIEQKDTLFEDELWEEFYSFLLKEHLIAIKKDNSIICIGFYNLPKVNASQLFRFLGKVEIFFPKNNLIIYDIQTDLLFELLDINKSYLKSNTTLPYWNSDIVTLVYSYKEIEKSKDEKEKNSKKIQNIFYFTDALWGKDRNDFLYINSLIQKSNYNSISLYPGFKKEDKDNIVPSHLPINNLFYENITLLPFDLLIKDEEKTTLFEYNAYTLLKNELSLKDDQENQNGQIKPIEDIKKQIQDLPGFKLSNSHFRLGSKIHITDYFYAKRFFQSSFYANRFAFIIAKYIIETFNEEDIKNSTLIGYGIYSELLISLTVGILKKYFEKKNEEKRKKNKDIEVRPIYINHNLFDDTENLTLMKNYDEIDKNIFIIVPIASTFSTSLKIEEKLRNTLNVDNHTIHPIHINILAVSDGNMQNKKQLSSIEKKFGWQNINNAEKHVEVMFYDFKNELRTQKYFLSLPSQWQSIDNCIKCFPKSNSNCPDKICKECVSKDDPNVCILLEKPLLMTDKTSVTPALIFDYPQAKIVDEEELKQKFTLTTNALEYGHTSRNNSHFHYYIYDEKFYSDNESIIIEWLHNVKSQLQSPDYSKLEKNKFDQFIDKLEKMAVSSSNEEKTWFNDKKSNLNKLIKTKRDEQFLDSLKRKIDNEKENDDIIQSIESELNKKWIEDFKNTIQIAMSLKYPAAKEFLIKVSAIFEHPIYSDADNVLIIAPEHFSNAGFVNLVNEILFANSANILHYDVWRNDFINFQTFYLDTVKKAAKIFFVDDTIVSGDTFFRSNDFIKHSTQKRHGFDACIVLINRVNDFTQRNISRKLPADDKKRFFSFANLHLPVLKSNGEECQLCSDYIKLKELFNESLLNRFKFHYHERIRKLKEKEINSYKSANCKTISFENNDRNIRKIEAIHRVFSCCISHKKELFSISDFKEWQEKLIEYSSSPLEMPLMCKPSQTELLPLSDDTATLLKVLALPPFNNYKVIKERIFHWTISLLNEQLEKIKNNGYEFHYEEFRDLKFLIRRAGLLNSNYLISIRFLRFVMNLYQNNCWESLINEYQKTINIEKGKTPENTEQIEELESKIENLNDFSSYIVAQIKELTYQNESRTIILERHLYELAKNKNFSHKKLIQLFRVIQEENGILIKRFWEFAKKEIVEKSLIIDSDNYNIQLFKDIKKFEGHYQYQVLRDFFKESQHKEPCENEDFNNFITLQAFLSQESEDRGSDLLNDFSLQKKTIILGNNLQKLIFQNNQSSYNGMFLLVKYRKSGIDVNIPDTNIENKINYLFLAYNKGIASRYIENHWDRSDNYIHGFLKGEKNKQEKYLITIDLLEKKGDEWESLYATPETNIKIDYFNEMPEVKYLLLLRLSIKDFNDIEIDPEQTSQGVLAFYSDKNYFDIFKTRYLLLLRDSISQFIKKHHKNDEFRDWKEAYDDIRKSDLAGHGREMLLELAKDDDRYKQIILNMEHIQIIQRLGATRLGVEEQSNIGDLFNKFYYVDGAEIIDKKYIDSLKDLCEKIFSSYRIENPEPLDFDLKIDNNLHFPFSQSILDIIFFEIFINAKKNRWINIEGDDIINGYEKNKIEIEVRSQSDQLILTVKNTGPLVEESTIDELKKGDNPKGKKRIAGISLINNLLTRFKMPSGKSLGKLDFDIEEILREKEFGKFVVIVVLNKME